MIRIYTKILTEMISNIFHYKSTSGQLVSYSVGSTFQYTENHRWVINCIPCFILRMLHDANHQLRLRRGLLPDEYTPMILTYMAVGCWLSLFTVNKMSPVCTQTLGDELALSPGRESKPCFHSFDVLSYLHKLGPASLGNDISYIIIKIFHCITSRRILFFVGNG